MRFSNRFSAGLVSALLAITLTAGNVGAVTCYASEVQTDAQAAAIVQEGTEAPAGQEGSEALAAWDEENADIIMSDAISDVSADEDSADEPAAENAAEDAMDEQPGEELSEVTEPSDENVNESVNENVNESANEGGAPKDNNSENNIETSEPDGETSQVEDTAGTTGETDLQDTNTTESPEIGITEEIDEIQESQEVSSEEATESAELSTESLEEDAVFDTEDIDVYNLTVKFYYNTGSGGTKYLGENYNNNISLDVDDFKNKGIVVYLGLFAGTERFPYGEYADYLGLVKKAVSTDTKIATVTSYEESFFIKGTGKEGTTQVYIDIYQMVGKTRYDYGRVELTVNAYSKKAYAPILITPSVTVNYNKELGGAIAFIPGNGSEGSQFDIDGRVYKKASLDPSSIEGRLEVFSDTTGVGPAMLETLDMSHYNTAGIAYYFISGTSDLPAPSSGTYYLKASAIDMSNGNTVEFPIKLNIKIDTSFPKVTLEQTSNYSTNMFFKDLIMEARYTCQTAVVDDVELKDTSFNVLPVGHNYIEIDDNTPAINTAFGSVNMTDGREQYKKLIRTGILRFKFDGYRLPYDMKWTVPCTYKVPVMTVKDLSNNKTGSITLDECNTAEISIKLSDMPGFLQDAGTAAQGPYSNSSIIKVYDAKNNEMPAGVFYNENNGNKFKINLYNIDKSQVLTLYFTDPKNMNGWVKTKVKVNMTAPKPGKTVTLTYNKAADSSSTAVMYDKEGESVDIGDRASDTGQALFDFDMDNYMISCRAKNGAVIQNKTYNYTLFTRDYSDDLREINVIINVIDKNVAYKAEQTSYTVNLVDQYMNYISQDYRIGVDLKPANESVPSLIDRLKTKVKFTDAKGKELSAGSFTASIEDGKIYNSARVIITIPNETPVGKYYAAIEPVNKAGVSAKPVKISIVVDNKPVIKLSKTTLKFDLNKNEGGSDNACTLGVVGVKNRARPLDAMVGMPNIVDFYPRPSTDEYTIKLRFYPDESILGKNVVNLEVLYYDVQANAGKGALRIATVRFIVDNTCSKQQFKDNQTHVVDRRAAQIAFDGKFVYYGTLTWNRVKYVKKDPKDTTPFNVKYSGGMYHVTSDYKTKLKAGTYKIKVNIFSELDDELVNLTGTPGVITVTVK